MNKKAIILGAGPAGLVTGWLLSKSGWIVEIYEKNKVVGGMYESWKWKNNILDTGPHIFIHLIKTCGIFGIKTLDIY